MWQACSSVSTGPISRTGKGACTRYFLSSVVGIIRLLLDSRVVDVLRLFNLMLVTVTSLKPFFFNGLKKALPFSDNVGAEDPGIQ